MGPRGGGGEDGKIGTWIWRNEIQRGVRNWNRAGEIGCSGPQADGAWEMEKGNGEMGPRKMEF